MQRPPLHALTSLRFFAAGGVVLFHMGGLMPFGYVFGLANGVSLFFVLSGFILTYNYPVLRDNIGRFYLARFARLWPVHIFTLGLVMVLIPDLGTWAASERGMMYLLGNILLLQSWVPTGGSVFSFNGVSWSISTEIFFYAVFPIALLFQRIYLLAVTTFAASLAIVTYIYIMGAPLGVTPPGSWTWHHVLLHFPPMRLFEFLAGMAAARIFVNRGKFVRDTTWLECAAIAAALGSVAMMSHITGVYGIWLSQTGSFLAFAVLIYVLAAGNGLICRALGHPILVRLGEISFATYMVHHMLIRHATQSKMLETWNTAAAAITLLLTIYLASYAIWRLVEVPARQAILSFRRPVAAPAE